MTLILSQRGRIRQAAGDGGGISPPITSGLVLHYDFNNTDSYPGSGTTVTDMSSTGADGTLTNGPVFNSGSPASLTFDGDNDYIVSGNTATYPALNCSTNNAMTVALAVKWGGFGDSFQRFFDKSTGGFGAGGYAMSTGTNASDKMYFYTAGTSAKMDSGSFVMSNLTVGSWFIMVVGYDGSNVLNDYWFINNTDYAANGLTATIPATSATLRIGTLSTLSTREYKGDIGFFSVWDRLLSGSEATTIWDTYKAQYGLS